MTQPNLEESIPIGGYALKAHNGTCIYHSRTHSCTLTLLQLNLYHFMTLANILLLTDRCYLTFKAKNNRGQLQDHSTLPA